MDQVLERGTNNALIRLAETSESDGDRVRAESRNMGGIGRNARGDDIKELLDSEIDSHKARRFKDQTTAEKILKRLFFHFDIEQTQRMQAKAGRAAEFVVEGIRAPVISEKRNRYRFAKAV